MTEREELEQKKRQLSVLQAQVAILEKNVCLAEEVARRRANKNKRASVQNLRVKGQELAKTVEVGDMVRLVGVRNTRYNWRKVDRVYDSGYYKYICGFQYHRDRKGNWHRGTEYTENGVTNIREVVKAADVNLS